MQMRTLGRTELVVARLGLGLAGLGRPGYISLAEIRRYHEQVDQ
jgi:aryl-alcohol dehydrogenase-like predicted oxidoreductase